MKLTIALVAAVAAISLTLAGVGAIPSRWQRIGVNVDPTNTRGGNASAAALTALGTGWARIEFKDPNSGTASVAAFGAYDGVVRAYTQAGISVLLIIDYMTLQQNVPWGQAAAGAWAGYVTTLAGKAHNIAAHYAGAGAMIAYEIWNEPDLQQTLVPPAAYAAMLVQVTAAIRRVAPAAKVIMGGLASGNPGYVSQVEASCPGRQLPVDAVTLHPYGQRPTADWPSPSWGFGVVTQLIANYRAVTKRPIWVSEYGTNDETTEAQYPGRMMAAMAGADVEVAVFFCWSDNMVNGFGLLDAQGNKKPAYSSYSTYSHQ